MISKLLWYYFKKHCPRLPPGLAQDQPLPSSPPHAMHDLQAVVGQQDCCSSPHSTKGCKFIQSKHCADLEFATTRYVVFTEFAVGQLCIGYRQRLGWAQWSALGKALWKGKPRGFSIHCSVGRHMSCTGLCCRRIMLMRLQWYISQAQQPSSSGSSLTSLSAKDCLTMAQARMQSKGTIVCWSVIASIVVQSIGIWLVQV